MHTQSRFLEFFPFTARFSFSTHPMLTVFLLSRLMDVFFQPTIGKPFSIEVGYFDTVLEIKEKIEKDQGISISTQTLIFNGNVLQDDLNIHNSDILDRSEIRLVVAVEPDNQNVKSEQLSPSKKIQLLLKMPTSKLGVALEMEVSDTIKTLKEKVHEMEGVSTSRLLMNANGIELQDHRTLDDYELVDHSEIDVIVRPSSATSSGSSGSTGGSKKLKIMVLTMCGRKIPMDVSPSGNVGELRKELQKLNQEMNLNLAEEGYFFIFKQNVMEDDRSFRWHHVGQGDTIEIFNGSISGGQ